MGWGSTNKTNEHSIFMGLRFHDRGPGIRISGDVKDDDDDLFDKSKMTRKRAV